MKKKDVTIEFDNAEYMALEKFCELRHMPKSEICREFILKGMEDLEMELAETGTITINIRHSFEIFGESERAHVYLLPKDLERFNRLVKFTGLSYSKLTRYWMIPTLYQL